jgi:hypothetical protein
MTNIKLRYVDISCTLLPLQTEQTIVGSLIPTSTDGRSVLVVGGNRFPMVLTNSFLTSPE